jgi:hypothetical protein
LPGFSPIIKKNPVWKILLGPRERDLHQFQIYLGFSFLGFEFGGLGFVSFRFEILGLEIEGMGV